MNSLAALAAGVSPDSIVFAGTILAAGAMGMGTLMWLERRRSRQAAARQAAEQRTQPAAGPFAPEAAMRERAAFDQHMEASKTGVAKMRREMELLEIQMKLATREVSTRQDMRDYHDLMMDKARLEIESLRLHIKEQRKRLDEFGTQDE